MAPPGTAPQAEAAPAPRQPLASVPMGSVTMLFESGGAQGGLTLRLTDADSGKVVREIRLENTAAPESAKSHRPGQIVDLRA